MHCGKCQGGGGWKHPLPPPPLPTRNKSCIGDWYTQCSTKVLQCVIFSSSIKNKHGQWMIKFTLFVFCVSAQVWAVLAWQCPWYIHPTRDNTSGVVWGGTAVCRLRNQKTSSDKCKLNKQNEKYPHIIMLKLVITCCIVINVCLAEVAC